MGTPFAAIESSINAACIGALANVSATLASGAVVNGILSAPTGAQIGIISTAPELVAHTSDLATVANGQTITINSVAYTVRAIEPDGTGITRLTLE